MQAAEIHWKIYINYIIDSGCSWYYISFIFLLRYLIYTTLSSTLQICCIGEAFLWSKLQVISIQ